MDFIVGSPRTQSDYDSIWVIVDQLTKVTHFIPIKTTYSGPQLAELYMSIVDIRCARSLLLYQVMAVLEIIQNNQSTNFKIDN
jgi:hypothetical protein